MISAFILTKNEQIDLPQCLNSLSWCDDVHVLDSRSEDSTIKIAAQFGAKISIRTFDDWASHQNWGLRNIPFKYPWVFYIDADERVSPELAKVLQSFEYPNNDIVAYEIQRRDFAWNGRWLKNAQISPYYLRLFRPDKMRYERLVNPVSIPDGKVGRMEGYLDHYPFSKGIKFWIQRHLGYADMEAAMRLNDLEAGKNFSLYKALFGSDFTEKRFHQKGLFYKMPARPFIKWLYMVFGRRAFLDGSAGVTYATLQSIYEYFIVLKTRELLQEREKETGKHITEKEPTLI